MHYAVKNIFQLVSCISHMKSLIYAKLNIQLGLCYRVHNYNAVFIYAYE